MAKKYAEAHLEIDPNAIAQPVRRRQAEGNIEVESLPGFDAEAGQTFQLSCESLAEVQELFVAIEAGDEETVRKYIDEGK